MGHPTMQENDTAKLTPTALRFIANHHQMFPSTFLSIRMRFWELSCIFAVWKMK